MQIALSLKVRKTKSKLFFEKIQIFNLIEEGRYPFFIDGNYLVFLRVGSPLCINKKISHKTIKA
jgi:hypothetical protein